MLPRFYPYPTPRRSIAVDHRRHKGQSTAIDHLGVRMGDKDDAAWGMNLLDPAPLGRLALQTEA